MMMRLKTSLVLPLVHLVSGFFTKYMNIQLGHAFTICRLQVRRLDELALHHSHRVLGFPPYHCHFNPIKMAWSECKRYYDANIGSIHPVNSDAVLVLWNEALEKTQEFCKMSLIEGIHTPCGTNLDGTTAQLFLMLINTLMGTQCSLGHKGHYPSDSTHKLQDGDEFDFIIVGSGSSGSVLANKLSEKSNWKILLLEAGDYPSATSDVPSLIYNLQGTAEDWRYKTERSDTSCKGFIDGECRWPRGKVLGGSSTINAMMHVRGSDRDYDEWEHLGNIGWNYDEIERHFKEIENVRSNVFLENSIYGNSGRYNLSWYDNGEPISKSIVEGVDEMGFPTGSTVELNPRKPLGYYQTLMAIDGGLRIHAAKTFLGQTKDRDNLILVTKAHVTRVLIDKNSLEARGVEARIADRTWTFLARKEVILSAGTLNTPQILLHSGIGPKADLEDVGINTVKDLAGVGVNLQDHVAVPLYYKLNEEAYTERNESYVLDSLYSYFKSRDGPLGKIYLTNLNGFINTKMDSQYPNIQMIHIGFRKKDQFFLSHICKSFGYRDEITQELLKNNDESAMIFIGPLLLNPKSTGSMKLKSKDSLEPAKFYSGYFSDPDGDDMKTMFEAIEFVKKLVETPSMKQYNPSLVKLPLPTCESITNTDENWECYVQHVANTLYHQVGTAKMGPSGDEMAVVDARLRVHGVKKLRVIDASIMPKITSGNTNGPSLVIGHKGGEMILEDWKYAERMPFDEL